MPRLTYKPKNSHVFGAHLTTTQSRKILFHYWHGSSAAEADREIAKWALGSKRGETRAKVHRKTILKWFHYFGGDAFDMFMLRRYWPNFNVMNSDHHDNLDDELRSLWVDLYGKAEDFYYSHIYQMLPAEMDRKQLKDHRRRYRESMKGKRLGHAPWAQRIFENTLLDLSKKMRGVSRQYFHTYLARAFLIDCVMEERRCSRTDAEEILFKYFLAFYRGSSAWHRRHGCEPRSTQKWVRARRGV